jgi:uncharacterized membrane protein
MLMAHLSNPPGRARGLGLLVPAVLLAVALLAAGRPGLVVAAEAAVRAVLFFSPSCPHCHQVIEQDLPSLQARYGDTLQILLVDVTTPAGEDLYRSAIVALEIPDTRIGVPTLVVGDQVLVGSVEIPTLLPAEVDRLAAGGGSDWPDIPGLGALVPEGAATPAPAAPDEASPRSTPLSADTAAPPAESALELAARDPIGSALAVAVLIWLAAALLPGPAALVRAIRHGSQDPPSGWIAVFAVAGLIVAGYLSTVELTGAVAVCGPVGDCNAVHASSYARLFGVPVGLLGVVGYLAILGSWIVARSPDAATTTTARIGILAVALVGSAFSAYLTFLEPFVLGATCAWCLLSAGLMGMILVLAARAPGSVAAAR